MNPNMRDQPNLHRLQKKQYTLQVYDTLAVLLKFTQKFAEVIAARKRIQILVYGLLSPHSSHL